MKKIDKITAYVSKLFDLYCMNDNGFFRDYDEDLDKTVEVPLFRFGKKETLQKISVNFGITPEEILTMDEDAMLRYWNKYPFFKLYKKYTHLCEWNHKYKDPEPTEEQVLLNAIFTDNAGIPIRYRYNFQSIKKRLIEQLKEFDNVKPGTYHKGAEITNLRIRTQTYFSFPECTSMVCSFLDMVDRLQELFYKTIETDLLPDEIREMNFLASYLCAKDKVTLDKVTYDIVRCYREIYKEENLKNFFEYVTVDKDQAFIITCPWRCPEFFSDTAMLQRFVTVFPQAKSMMREFGMELTNFICVFEWSDAKPICFSEEEERELASFEELCRLKPTPVEERAKEQTEIYVKKNRSELYGWGSYIKTLKKACGPVAKGGLEIPMRLPFSILNGGLDRMSKRINARRGGEL